MIIRCLQKKPNDAQVVVLGSVYKQFSLENDSHLSVGKTYLVLGITMNTSYPKMGIGTWVTLLCDYNHIESYPIVLFDVVTGQVDPEWVVRSRPDGIVEIQPELLHKDYFTEDYLDGVPEVIKPFHELLRRMKHRQELDVEAE